MWPYPYISPLYPIHSVTVIYYVRDELGCRLWPRAGGTTINRTAKVCTTAFQGQGLSLEATRSHCVSTCSDSLCLGQGFNVTHGRSTRTQRHPTDTGDSAIMSKLEAKWFLATTSTWSPWPPRHSRTREDLLCQEAFFEVFQGCPQGRPVLP
jgi:hypothetical protein